MTIPLPATNLSGATVGQTGKLDFTQNVPAYSSAHLYQQGQFAHIQFFNDSGAGLLIQFLPSTNSDILPAGAWRSIVVEPDDTSFAWTVLYTLPNPPVSLLLPVYYLPGEVVPDIGQLGNSPVGIGGNVTTSSIQTLSNEGSASGLLVIDMGDTANNQILTFFNDGHCTWAVDQSGTKHQVIKVQTSGNPLLLGQSGDIVEVLGDLQADGNVILNTNNKFVEGKDQAGTVYNMIGFDSVTAKQLDIGQSVAGFIISLIDDILAQSNLTLNTNNTFLKGKDQAGTIYHIAGFDSVTAKQLNLSDSTSGILLNILSNILTQGNLTVSGSELVSGQASFSGTITNNTAAIVTINGSVAGTCTIWQPETGSALKIVIINFVGFNTANNVTQALTGGFQNGAMALAGGGGPIVLKNGGANQTVRVQTGFPSATAAGAQTPTTSGILSGWSFGQVMGAFDSVQVLSTSATAFSGMIVLIGN